MASTLSECNACWQPIPIGAKCVVTRCCHLFCYGCAEQIVTAGAPCTTCGKAISRKQVKLLDVMDPTCQQIQTMLIGQCPETALNAVSYSIRFWSQQQQLKKDLIEQQYQNRLRKNEQRVTKVKQQANDQLEKLHTAYKTTKRKVEELSHANAQLSQELDEMMSKYEHKCKQTRSLQEMLRDVQHDPRATGALGHPAAVTQHMMGGGRAGGAHHHSGGSGGGLMAGGFGDSGMHQQHHTVTTVRQTRAVFEMSPGDGGGGGGGGAGMLLGGGFTVGGMGGLPPSAGGGHQGRARRTSLPMAGAGGLLRAPSALPPTSPAPWPGAAVGGSGGMFDDQLGSAGRMDGGGGGHRGAARSLACLGGAGGGNGHIGAGGAGATINALLGGGGARHGGGAMAASGAARNKLMGAGGPLVRGGYVPMSPSMNTT
ncbi:hypothetical protein Rsub_05071 [Raphidocelis subcapitata]|uniref:RING-type domain-containing protein n=1 Tax=Raphidocelis subcapitata TaxID=307507 RepID=A0A2V0P1A2_9CHLO|nr:hypothetical protein Rsub_05071 [Raphidocelis subcapitata]|eukprot:GBF92702.1 hypothetical protein Rsub_05071 [Raphidocelis subcapitata]